MTFPQVASEDLQLENLSIRSDTFFELFPFHVVFDRNMAIRSIGAGLKAVMPHIEGQTIDEMFCLSRPLLEFTLENVSIDSSIVTSRIRRHVSSISFADRIRVEHASAATS